ncbi:MAG: hypothetical protein B6I20_07630 [Bacteroidetes bacterium 4572_117]|nr:MAG: hypothetical protein B6I20_07630 [Bacteroidetes bacterium 4572_117]
MKKIAFLLVMILLSTNFYAQKKRGKIIKWLSISAKAGYGNSILVNSDVIADEDANIDFASPAYNFGGRFGVTFGDNVGIFVEPLFSSFNQEYSINTGNTIYDKTQEFKSFDMVLELRYTSDFGFYFEAGPVLTKLKSANETNTGTVTVPARTNYFGNFKTQYTSVMFGLGFAAFRGDRFAVNLGLRGTYALGNFVENSSFYVLDDGVYHTSASSVETKPFSAKLMIEVNYFFGFWGDANCGRGRLMFFQ